MTRFWRCRECDWEGKEENIIRFADPIRADNHWNICPECRAAAQFDDLCDEPGCKAVATCGWPSFEGYRRTCGRHMEGA